MSPRQQQNKAVKRVRQQIAAELDVKRVLVATNLSQAEADALDAIAARESRTRAATIKLFILAGIKGATS